jgi:DNA-binding transcriptional LysR family regulator
VRTLTLAEEPRVFVIATNDPLAANAELSVNDASRAPWIAAKRATDGCEPERWRDFWLVNPRPNGSVPVVAAEAATIDEWREYAAAGVGISLCPASAETHYSRPGLAFIPATDAVPARLAVAWREDDADYAQAFIDLAAEVANDQKFSDTSA